MAQEVQIEDFIKVLGSETLAPFQGISGTLSADMVGGGTSEGGTDSTDDTADSLPDAIWEAQTTYINGETAYLTQLNTEWKELQEQLEGGTIKAGILKIWDAISETAEEGATAFVLFLLAKAGVVVSGGWLIAIGVGVSLLAAWGMDKFGGFLIPCVR